MREESTEHARSYFTSMGFTVEDIPEALAQKRADLRATIKGEEYIVEAKHRQPEREWRAAMLRLEVDGFATASREILPWATLSKSIHNAHAQLSATPAGPEAFRILWIAALHDDDHFVISCVRKCLLGTHRVLVFRDLAVPPQDQYCYYYDENDFESCPQIDAAALCTRASAQLIVNNHSPRCERFRRSHLYSVVAAHNALTDGEIEAQDGKALMLGMDFQGPRDGAARGAYLGNKYGVRVMPMNESAFTGVALYPTTTPSLGDDQPAPRVGPEQ